MDKQVKEPTKSIIGPAADQQRRANIQNEINLPNKTAFQMCIKSIFIRIGRVAITASGIFLGIAFYASVQMTAIVQDATRLQEERRAGEVAVTGAEATALDMEKEAQIAQEKARTTWLIVMALMVSVVGICNSMLMAVTERFQEIGTMKCLGALDQFIVKLFLIESGLLGGLAGITGSLVGIVVMYAVNAFRYDFRFGDVWLGMVSIAVWSVVLGTVLSIVAAIIPARQAAKMPAAAALRTTV
jgi:predicted lysophospholipase L1 biosynthesis ABC-type transport system permease subunit